MVVLIMGVAGSGKTTVGRALAAIRAHLDDCLARGLNAVVTCSALKEKYRAALVTDPARVELVRLAGDPAVLASQLAALEPPRDALTVDLAHPPDTIVAQIRRAPSP